MHRQSLPSPAISIYFCICVCLNFCSETLWLYFQETDEVSRANMEVKTKLSHIRSHEEVLDWGGRLFEGGVNLLSLQDEVLIAATNLVPVILASTFSFSFKIHLQHCTK